MRALLRRRSRWLIVFGAVHTALLFFGEILAVYGLLAPAFVGALRFRDRTLGILAAAWPPLGATVYTLHFQLTSPALAAGIAVAVWLATVALADPMRRRNAPGPAEVAPRRLAYRL